MSYTDIKHQIDILNKQIIANGELTPEQKKKINYKFRLEWNYNSNSMEGNTLTIAETRSVMVGNLDVHQKPLKDVLEMRGHDEVISDILKIGKGEVRLSEARIKQIHKGIIHESDEIKKEQIGEWKTSPNEIINPKGEKYSFVPPDEVRDRMHDLLNKTNAALDAVHNNKRNAPHPIDIALNFHLEFLNIHPFHDGNGRSARILMNLILISLGYPPFWISKDERNIYYQYIADIQGYGGDEDLLNEFIGELILRSQQLVADVIEGKDIDGEDDLQKEISLLKRQLEGEKFTKSPRNVYEVFRFSEDKIWKPLSDVLHQFDDVFNENKTKRFVNFLDEYFPKESILNIPEIIHPLQKSTKPKEYKIFGHDIYETDVDSIKWEHKKYGLKKAKYNTQHEIKLSLSLNPYVYVIELWLDYKQIFEKEYAYNAFPDVEIIKKLKKDLGKEIILSIKLDIG